MASDHADPGQTPPEHAAEEPTRPTQPHHPGHGWPGDAGMVAQNAAAQAQFQHNSERRQESAAVRDAAELQGQENEGKDDQLGEDRSPSAPNYAVLKQEHAAAEGRSKHAETAEGEPKRDDLDDHLPQADGPEKETADQALAQQERNARFRSMMETSQREVFSRQDLSHGVHR
jgi:hypothetical protein